MHLLSKNHIACKQTVFGASILFVGFNNFACEYFFIRKNKSTISLENTSNSTHEGLNDHFNIVIFLKLLFKTYMYVKFDAFLRQKLFIFF